MKDLTLLARSVPFVGLNDDELQRVLALARLYSVKRGEFFYHQDDEAKLLYVLKEGRLKVTQIGMEGRQVVHNFFGPGDMFGGIAVLPGATYPTAAEAVEDSVAYGWDGAAVYRLMEEVPTVARNFVIHLAERVIFLQDRVRELTSERVEQRLARTLLRVAHQASDHPQKDVDLDEKRPEITLALSRQDLAEMSGTTLYTVSRILTRWEQQGLVTLGRERVGIADLEGLEQLAEESSD